MSYLSYIIFKDMFFFIILSIKINDLLWGLSKFHDQNSKFINLF